MYRSVRSCCLYACEILLKGYDHTLLRLRIVNPRYCDQVQIPVQTAVQHQVVTVSLCNPFKVIEKESVHRWFTMHGLFFADLLFCHHLFATTLYKHLSAKMPPAVLSQYLYLLSGYQIQLLRPNRHHNQHHYHYHLSVPLSDIIIHLQHH
jgi:hypothetical protein